MRKKYFFIIVFLYFSQCVNAQWPMISQDAKPWTRWWWMGDAVDSINIKNQLCDLQKVGFGGVEIVPIYGAKGYEKKFIPYLSKSWMQMLDYTVKQSNQLDMGVYLAMGSGWPIGGPQVSLENAATKLTMESFFVKEGQSLTEKIQPRSKYKSIAKLSFIMAYGDNAEVKDITSFVNADGQLTWTAPKGSWKLMAAFVSKTLQKVKRAAPGAEGYTLDHFSLNALPAYLQQWDTLFKNDAHGIKAFYNDSYEVENANWTPTFLNDFATKRGYDFKPFLNYLNSSENTEIVRRVKSDYRETLSDLILQNFANPYHQFAQRKKTLSLNEAHGSPGNLLDLYAAVDIPEIETFGSSYFPYPGLRRDSADIRNVDPDPMMLQFASSASHVMGKPLVSCESFTWLTEHFKTSWSQCKPEIDQAFLSGVNHVVYHGTTYSPQEAVWPGWLFYASVEFIPANSLWSHLKGLNNYIARTQSILQEGKPDNEVLAYWPIYDIWSKPVGLEKQLKVHDVDEWLHPSSFYKNMQLLKKQGYAFDFVSDKMLQNANNKNGQWSIATKGASYPVLLVSKSEFIPLETLASILQNVYKGATVIFEALPTDVPGLFNLDQRRIALKKQLELLPFTEVKQGLMVAKYGKGKCLLASQVQNAMEYLGIHKEENITQLGLKYIKRKVAGNKNYFIVNATDQLIDTQIVLHTSSQQIVLLNPMNGQWGKVKSVSTSQGSSFRVKLASGASLIVQAKLTHKQSVPKWIYGDLAQKINMNGSWNLSFKEGGPVLPQKQILPNLKNWTDLNKDTLLYTFSGIGIYETSVVVDKKNSQDFILKLGKVNESAKVFVNGKEAGISWSFPFELSIGRFLQQGKNTITIEVANLMANRIRYMDQHKMEWRKFTDINFVNINYKPFDASSWKVQAAGLEGEVALYSIR